MNCERDATYTENGGQRESIVQHGHLVGVHIEALGKLRECLVAFDGARLASP